MPAAGFLSDAQVAAVLTYVRREWDHEAAPVADHEDDRDRERPGDRREEVQNRFRQAAIEMANRIKVQNKKIDETIKLFRENYSRDPLKEELQESLYGQVDEDILTKYFEKHGSHGSENNV